MSMTRYKQEIVRLAGLLEKACRNKVEIERRIDIGKQREADSDYGMELNLHFEHAQLQVCTDDIQHVLDQMDRLRTQHKRKVTT